jgi:drug/metabolite transporter (DMT)-like permease
MDYIGEIIALTTVLCWTLSVQFFEAAAKRIGSACVNIIRLALAILFFTLLLFFREGQVIPLNFPVHSWIYLSLSGIIGFFFGDIFLFKALVALGPRVTMLIQSLAAPTAAIIGWAVLKETYLPLQWLGMLIALFGVSLVVLEKSSNRSPSQKLQARTISLTGVCYALCAMTGQAGGMVLSKLGMQSGTEYLDAFSSTQIRAIAAFICFLVLFSVTNKWPSLMTSIHDRTAVTATALGSFLGPFIGVSLALLSLHYLPTGIASTFFSLIPICIIPFSILLHKEHVSLRAVAGACIAVFGVYLLVS